VPVLLLLRVATKVSNRLQLPYVESFLFSIFFIEIDFGSVY
jgi:hypothetical protein